MFPAPLNLERSTSAMTTSTTAPGPSTSSSDSLMRATSAMTSSEYSQQQTSEYQQQYPVSTVQVDAQQQQQYDPTSLPVTSVPLTVNQQIVSGSGQQVTSQPIPQQLTATQQPQTNNNTMVNHNQIQIQNDVMIPGHGVPTPLPPLGNQSQANIPVPISQQYSRFNAPVAASTTSSTGIVSTQIEIPTSTVSESYGPDLPQAQLNHIQQAQQLQQTISKTSTNLSLSDIHTNSSTPIPNHVSSTTPPELQLPGGRYTGILHRWVMNKGIGFITPDYTPANQGHNPNNNNHQIKPNQGKDLLVHHTEVNVNIKGEDGFVSVKEGQPCEYGLKPDIYHKKKFLAIQVTAIGGGLLEANSVPRMAVSAAKIAGEMIMSGEMGEMLQQRQQLIGAESAAAGGSGGLGGLGNTNSRGPNNQMNQIPQLSMTNLETQTSNASTVSVMSQESNCNMNNGNMNIEYPDSKRLKTENSSQNQNQNQNQILNHIQNQQNQNQMNLTTVQSLRDDSAFNAIAAVPTPNTLTMNNRQISSQSHNDQNNAGSQSGPAAQSKSAAPNTAINSSSSSSSTSTSTSTNTQTNTNLEINPVSDRLQELSDSLSLFSQLLRARHAELNGQKRGTLLDPALLYMHTKLKSDVDKAQRLLSRKIVSLGWSEENELRFVKYTYEYEKQSDIWFGAVGEDQEKRK